MAARYEHGALKLERPAALREGERVGVIVVREPDPARWDFARLAGFSKDDDVTLAEAGLDDWAGALEREDHR